MDWSILLYLFKFIILILVYSFLVVLFTGITREMRLRLPQSAPQSSVISYGRLRVLQPGTDPHLKQGSFLLLQPETRLGSKRGNTIQLSDRYISGNHARLRWDGISWWVEDLNSTNGTYLDRKRILPGAPVQIPFGATLQLGDMNFEMIE